MLTRLAVITAVLALGTVGCSGGVSEGPYPAPYNPSDARSVFGDVTTVDPCSLIDTAALPASLHASRQPLNSLDECTLTIDAAGTPANAYVGELLSSTGKNLTGGQAVAGGLTLYPDPPGDLTCFAYLHFPVHPVYLTVLVSTSNNAPAAQSWCTAAQDIAKNVATVVAKHPAGHLTGVAPNSFSRINACGTVDGSVLAAAGLAAPITFPARHQCLWHKQDDASGESAQLVFAVGPLPQPGPGGTSTTIDGRPSVVQPRADSGYGTCTIETGGSAFGPAAQHRVELAHLYVFGPDSTTACQLATTMANAAWPKL